MKLAVCYLAHRRPQFFELFSYFLKKIKPENKKQIEFHVMNTEGCFTSKNIKQFTNDIGIQFVFHNFPNNLNYTAKVNTFIETGADYYMKLDEDVFFNNYVWDYLIENISVLDDPKNLCVAPLISNGIPSVELFIDCFFTPEEKKTIYTLFQSYKLGNYWNINYNNLNLSGNWNPDKFFEKVRNFPHYYKGVHPIRFSGNAHDYLIERILEKIDIFLKKSEYELLYTNYPYFCNSVMVIKSETWKTIVNNKSLFKDEYDEVPLNLYREQNNLNYVFINNSFCINTVYNMLPNHWDVEKKFYANLKEKILG